MFFKGMEEDGGRGKRGGRAPERGAPEMGESKLPLRCRTERLRASGMTKRAARDEEVERGKRREERERKEDSRGMWK